MMSARSSLTRMRTPRHGVDLEPLVEPVQLAVKWPEASEALTRTPPRLLRDTSVPGDRAHPGGVLGNATAECRRCVPGETRPSHSVAPRVDNAGGSVRSWVKRHRTAKRERARLLEEFDQRYLGQTVARPPVAAGLPTVVADFLRSQLMQHVGP